MTDLPRLELMCKDHQAMRPAHFGAYVHYSDAMSEIQRLERLCKKHEATIQRYEDSFVNGDPDE